MGSEMCIRDRPRGPSLVEVMVGDDISSPAISPRLTASHPNSEVKLGRVGVVLRWGTAREGPMLDFFVSGYVAQDFLSGHGRPLCLLETTMLLMHKV